MAYFLIENFKSGLDVRKSALTAPAGTLMIADNAAISPGGEIAKRKAFVKVASVPGTFGLASLGNKLVVFTKNTTPNNPGLIGVDKSDVELEFHRVPNASPSSVQTDFDVFDGKIYLVMHDPTPADPTPVATGPALPAGVPTGTVYKITGENNALIVWRGDSWADWAANQRTNALPGRGYDGDTFKVKSTGRVYKFQSGSWYYQSGVTTASVEGDFLPSNKMEKDIYYNYTEDVNYIVTNRVWVPWNPDYTVATRPTTYKDNDAFKNTTDGLTYVWRTKEWVPFKPPEFSTTTSYTKGQFVSRNGTIYKANVNIAAGNFDVSMWVLIGFSTNNRASNPHYYMDDRDKVKDQMIQNLDQTWEWTTKVNPNKGTYQPTEGAGMGYFVRAYKSKLYCVGDKYLRFSAVDNAFLWEAATDPNDTSRTGAGYVNISLQEGGSSVLNGVEIYYDKLALFSENSTQMWSVVSDPKQNALGQVLRQTGTRAPWSVQQYGSGDILFLASSGIRSLKARDISNSAAVSDIGSPIDELVRSIPHADRVYCRSVLEPIVGRVWFAFRKKIFVLSFFPGPNITAWSTYSVPFDVEYVCVCNDRMFIRSGDDLYLYGGVDGETYDDCKVEVRLPFLDGGKPGHTKLFQGIDLTVTGTWDIAISYDPDNPDHEERVATISHSTWDKGRHELSGYANHMSLRFYSQYPGKGIVSNAAIHYSVGTDVD